MLVQLGAIDLVYETYKYKASEKADWAKFNTTQRTLIAQVEKWQTE